MNHKDQIRLTTHCHGESQCQLPMPNRKSLSNRLNKIMTWKRISSLVTSVVSTAVSTNAASPPSKLKSMMPLVLTCLHPGQTRKPGGEGPPSIRRNWQKATYVKAQVSIISTVVVLEDDVDVEEDDEVEDVVEVEEDDELVLGVCKLWRKNSNSAKNQGFGCGTSSALTKHFLKPGVDDDELLEPSVAETSHETLGIHLRTDYRL